MTRKVSRSSMAGAPECGISKSPKGSRLLRCFPTLFAIELTDYRYSESSH